MKKCLSLLIALSMLLAMCVLPVSAETEVPAWTNLPEGAKLIFAENFEEGYAEGNLLEAGKTSVEIKRTTDNTKVFKFGYQDTAKQTVSVVTGPETFNTSKVLKLTSSQDKSGGYIGQYIYLNNGNEITRTADTQLVVEYDIMVGSGTVASADAPLMSFGTSTTGKYPFTATGWGSNNFAFRRGTYADLTTDSKTGLPKYPEQYKRDWYVAGAKSIASKTTIKYVIEENITNFDTARFYADNALLTATSSKSLQNDWNTGKVVKDFIGTQDGWYPVNGYENTDAAKAYPAKVLESVDYVDFKFLYTNLASKTAGTDVVLYLDNIKVYEVPAIKFTGLDKSEGVELSEGVVVKFDQPFNATKDTFKVSAKSADTWIEDAVTEVTPSSDKKSATVKFDVEKLPVDTQFKLWIDDEFTSEAGAVFHKDIDGVLPGEEYVELTSFATLVPFTVVNAPESINGLIPNDPRTVEIEVSGTVESVVAKLGTTDLVTSFNGSTAAISFANVEEPVSGDVTVTITSDDNQTLDLTIQATSVKDGFTEIYNDNLSGYDVGKLVTDNSKSSATNGNLIINATEGYHVNYVYAAKPILNVGSAEIAEDPVEGKAQGNVLKLYNNGAGNISVTYKAPNADTTPDSLLGKVVVLKTKYYMPDTYATNNGNGGAAASLADSLTSAGTASTPNFRIRDKGALGYNSGNWGTNTMEQGWEVKNNEWIEVITVVDQTPAGTIKDPHTSRRYVSDSVNTDPVLHTIKAYHGTDVKANTTNDNYDVMYDVAPNGYTGTWDFSGLDSDNTAEKGTKFTATKLYGTYTALGSSNDKTGTKEGYIFIDDFQAYYADKFKITSISENKDMFYPVESTLKITFNQPIDQTQADSVKLYNAAGEVVEGWTADVVNGGYAIDFVLNDAAVEEGEYKIVFTPEFHDVRSFQGLGTKNKNLEYTLNVVKYEAFTATYEDTISDFISGKDTKSVIEFGTPTGLTNANVKEAFEVKDGEGNTVTNGWSATVAEDKMSITLDFTNLPEGNYTVTSNEKLVDTANKGLYGGQVINITITAKVKEIVLFEEDFEDYDENKVGVDWLEDSTAYDSTEWKLGYNKDLHIMSEDYVKVVNITEETDCKAKNSGITGKALKINMVPNPNNTTDHKYLYVKALSQLGAIDIENDEKYQNKVIVIEGDIYNVTINDGFRAFLPSFNSDAVTYPTFMKYNNRDKLGMEGSNAWFQLGNVSGGTANKAHNGFANYQTGAGDARIRIVVDQRNDVDTAKGFINGKQIYDMHRTYLTDHPDYKQLRYEFPMNIDTSSQLSQSASSLQHGAFQGFGIAAYDARSAGGNNSVHYIDNLEVYLVDAFEITGIEGAGDAFSKSKGAVKFNFTNKVDLDSAKANIKLFDSKGIDSTALLNLDTDASGYQIIATLSNDAKDGETYTFEVSPLIQDEFGVSLASKYYKYDTYATDNPNGGNGWIVKVGSTYTYHNTEEDANATAGTSGTIYPYTWKIEDGKATVENPFDTTKSSSVDGNGWLYDRTNMKLVTPITLAEYDSIHIKADSATVEDGKVTINNLIIANPDDVAHDVWYIVAVYGAYNEMLGCTAGEFKAANSNAVGAGQKIDLDSPVINVDGEVESVKIYLWDGYKSMIPYQDAKEIFATNSAE